MSYVFRLNTILMNGQSNLSSSMKGWSKMNIKGYQSSEIDQIQPSNPDSINEPTSIPSPFARLAITKTAFSEVTKHSTRSLKAYQQIVSNSLDIAEIFFNFNKLKDHIGLEIIKWTYSDLQKIESAILKSTLELFFNSPSDADSLNLSNNSTFYFIRHLDTGKIIGGTSPISLFFSAANVKRRKGGQIEPEFVKSDGTFFVKSESTNTETEFGKIKLSEDHFAFSDIKPLFKRSIAFQEYLHKWVAVNKNIKLDELRKYIENQIEADKKAHFQKLPENLDSYTPIQFVNANGDTIYPEINGSQLYEISVKKSEIKNASDFVLNSSDFEIEYPPLILGGTAAGIENWKLDSDTKWGDRVVDLTHDRNTLPGGGNYPWLTGEDFLEDKIVQLSKPIEKGYFTGGHTNNGEKSVLLPIKDKYFEFFTVEELKNSLKIDGSAAIKVTLQIPVKNGKKVTFTREYRNDDIIRLSEETNFLLFPNVRINNAQYAFYRFAIFKEFAESKKIKAFFHYKASELLLNEINEVITRNESDDKNNICTIYILERKVFDRIKLTIDNVVGGILIPDLEKRSENVDFVFAVDLGTTNTHVEYKTSSDGNIKPFDVTDQDRQISWIVNPGDKTSGTRLIADVDLIPEHVGFVDAKNIKVKFPTRTALLVAKNAVINNKLPFAHTNIVLPFDKRSIPVYNGEPITHLKWDSNIEEVGYYIENLCYLMRNKVVLGNGKLTNTKILWTYPLSMNKDRLEAVSEKWKEAYVKYFGQNVAKNCSNLTESLAPFFHYKNLSDYKESILDLVNIDIGGGTTDVVFVKNGEPKFVTSFRFAGNDLLGLGQYVSKIVLKHKKDIEEKISKATAGRSYLTKTISSIGQNTQYGDFASFFFSLIDNEDLNEKGIRIDFSKMLKNDDDQKLIFLLFYASIIYHAAHVLKAKNQTLPRYLSFSGNGSRIIEVLGKEDMLEKIAMHIFEKVLSDKYQTENCPKRLTIIPNTSNPKEVTCKGTLNYEEINNNTIISNDIFLGIDNIAFAQKNTYSELLKDEDLIGKIYDQVEEFFLYVLDELLKSEIKKQVGVESLQKALSITKLSISKARQVISNKYDLEVVIKNKLIKRRESDGDEIEETFFFLPFPTLLRTISNEIEKKED